MKALKDLPHRAWIEVELDALAHNAHVLQALLPQGCRLMPAIKANAYGLGAAPIGKALFRLGVRSFCVASLSEGIALRRQGLRGNILILGYTHPDDCHLVKRYRLAQTVVDYPHAVQLAKKRLSLPVHIKLDTGMHRLGQHSGQTDLLCKLFSLRGLRIQGIFTQLACCDSPNAENIACTNAQLSSFATALAALRARGIPLPETHIQSSYGIINYPTVQASYARPGLALFGIVDPACCIGPAPALKPIFTLKARVAQVKTIHAGQHVGYGTAFTAQKEMRIAAITLGYADGLPRCLSGGVGQVLLHGQRAPIVGNICMDQAMVDVSHIAAAAAGDVVTIIGRDGAEEITVNQLAKWAATIPNEITSRLGQRLAREYF